MTPRQRAAAAGDPTYLGGSTCSRGHQGARYTASGNCVQCTRAADDAPPPPDHTARELSAKLHGVQTDIRQTAARVKALLRKFDAESNPMRKVSLSGAIAREHNAWEAMQRQAAELELGLEAARPTPDPMRLAALLAAAGAPPTPPPVRFELRTVTDEEHSAELDIRQPERRWKREHAAQQARDKLVRAEVLSRLRAAHPDGAIWSPEEGERVRRQVSSEFAPALARSVEPDPPTDEDVARIARLLPTGD